MSDVLTKILASPLLSFGQARLAFLTKGDAWAFYVPADNLTADGVQTLLDSAVSAAGDASAPGKGLDAIQLAYEDIHAALALGRDTELSRAGRLDIIAQHANDLTASLGDFGALTQLQRVGSLPGDA